MKWCIKIQLKVFIKQYKKLIIFFALAIAIRVVIAVVHLTVFAVVEYHGDFWQVLMMNTVEPYTDYDAYYKTLAREFIFGGWLPYLEKIPYGKYGLDLLYPPFFLYTISVMAFISVDLVFLPLFIADILLPIIIYKFLFKLKGKVIAEWGFLATAFCPLSIFYDGGMFLNTSLVTLFFILSLYFLSIDKYKAAIIILAVSCLFKQTVIFYVLPIILYVIFRTSENEQSSFTRFSRAFYYFGLFGLIIVLGSLPWIILSPSDYIRCLSVGQSPIFQPEFTIPHVTAPMQWYSFLIQLGAPYWLLYVVGFLNFTLLGLFIIQVTDMLLLSRWYKTKSLDWPKILDIIVFTSILSHLFFSRGVYKYYFAFHVPLVILWLAFHFSEVISNDKVKRRKILIIFLSASFVILIFPRMYYLLLIWVGVLLMMRINLKSHIRINP